MTATCRNIIYFRVNLTLTGLLISILNMFLLLFTSDFSALEYNKSLFNVGKRFNKGTLHT